MPSKTTFDPNSLGFLLADASRLMRRRFQQLIESYSLTLAQARTLIYVARNDGIRQVELAELLEIQPITLTRLIDQLMKLELVERRPDASDRRAFQIVLTENAPSHLAAIKQVGEQIQREALQGVDAEVIPLVLEALKTIRNNLGFSH